MKMLLLQEEKKKGKKEKKFNMRPPGIKPGPTDSESDVLTTPPLMHMALTRDQAQMHANDSCIFKYNNDKNKNNKKKDARPKP